MAEQQLKLDGLRSDIREAVSVFGERLFEALGENLKSITVVGSSLTEDFTPGSSDINTVLVVGERSMAVLKSIGAMGKPMSKKRISAPLLMTKAYIERSLDVFGVEFYNFQLVHETVYGEDPFAGLEFAKADVRAQCERELKASLIRLRQGYISAAGNRKLVRDLLATAANSLVPLLRGMLWLKGIKVPKSANEVLSESKRAFGIDADSAIEEARGRGYAKVRGTEEQTTEMFESIYRSVDTLSRIVDELEVT